VGLSAVRFQVWGCRGGRNTHGSRIGNLTSCYSLRAGDDLYVFDAGRGLLVLADAVLGADPTLRGVARVHLLITHGHMDHWEGLKDASWMWKRGNGLDLTLIGPAEALGAIAAAHAPPSFVPLELLALGTLGRLGRVELAAGATLALPGATLRTVALHHYSGAADGRRYLDTLGYQLIVDSGPTVAYLSDHEPTADTRAVEDAVLAQSDLALIDANYGAVADHAYGHGSVEYAAALARRHPGVRVLAAHHGPLRDDDAIEAGLRVHAPANLALAIEGSALVWDGGARRFG